MYRTVNMVLHPLGKARLGKGMVRPMCTVSGRLEIPAYQEGVVVQTMNRSDGNRNLITTQLLPGICYVGEGIYQIDISRVRPEDARPTWALTLEVDRRGSWEGEKSPSPYRHMSITEYRVAKAREFEQNWLRRNKERLERQGILIPRLPKRRRPKGRVKAHNQAQQQKWQDFLREEHKFGYVCKTGEVDLSEEEAYFAEAQEQGIREIGNKAWNIAFPKTRITGKQAKRARQKANRGKRQIFRRPTTPKTVKIVRKGTMCKGTKVNGDRCSRRLPTKAPFCHQHAPVVKVDLVINNVREDSNKEEKQ